MQAFAEGFGVLKSNVRSGLSLDQFLSPKLGGSTLSLRKVSDDELFVESDAVIQIHIQIDRKDRKISEEIFSPKWGRKITVQQIDGNEFLELHAEEELQKENFEEIAEDVLLALDLARSWAVSNKFTVVEQGLEPEGPESLQRRAAPKEKNSKASRK